METSGNSFANNSLDESSWMKRVAWLLSAVEVSGNAITSGRESLCVCCWRLCGNICLVRFGYLTTDQTVELLFDAASDEGITGYQVGNLIKADGFESDLTSY